MISSIERFRAALAEFDRKSPTILTEAAIQCRSHPEYHEWLCTLAGDSSDPVSSGATWLIKYELEQGWEPSDDWIGAFAGRLGRIDAWDAQLHICQSIRFLSVKPRVIASFHAWVMPLLGHRRPFLRAWAADALFRLAQCDGRYWPEAVATLNRMAEDDAASVRARIRALLKEKTARET